MTRLVLLSFSFFLLTYSSSFSLGVDVKPDYSNKDFFKNTRLTLDKGWKIYPGLLLTPTDFPRSDGKAIKLESWTSLTDTAGKNLTSFGFVTYKLDIIISDSVPDMAFYMPPAYSTSKIWINGILRSELGVVGKDRESTVHKRVPQTIPFEHKGGHLSIIIQVANYYHQRGGILRPPILASSEVLRRSERNVIIAETLLIGSLGFIGLSFLMLFLFFWRKDYTILYFALFCLFWSYRSWSEGYAPLPNQFDFFPWLWHVRLEYIALFAGSIVGYLFFAKIFKKHVHPQSGKVVAIVASMFALATLLLPPLYFTKLLVPFFVLMAFNMSYIFLIIIKAALGHQRESRLALVTVVFSILILSSHMFSFFENSDQSLIYINVGYLIIFMMLSMLLGMRFSRSFHKLETLQVQTLEQNEEIASQADQLVSMNEQLTESGKELRLRNEEIRGMNEMLEEAIEMRTKRLEDVNKEMDTFLYRSSHDLVRPIKTIEGLVYLSEQTENMDDMKDLFDRIKSSVGSMNDLLSRLTKIHEIQNHVINNEKIDVEGFFDELTTSVKSKLRYPEQLKFDINHSGSIHLDRLLLRELLFQVFHNSAIWADHLNYQVVVTCFIETKKIGTTIRVSDNGPGIPKSSIDEVFEMYKVVNNTTKTHGLGLFIANKIVKKYNGNITLRSSEGKGTKVIITLPH